MVDFVPTLIAAGAGLVGALIGGGIVIVAQIRAWKREDRFRWASEKRVLYRELMSIADTIFKNHTKTVGLLGAEPVDWNRAFASIGRTADEVHRMGDQVINDISLLGTPAVTDAALLILEALEEAGDLVESMMDPEGRQAARADRRLDEIEKRLSERVEAFRAEAARDLGSISG